MRKRENELIMSVHNRPTHAWNYLRSRGFSDYVFQTCSIGFTPELMDVKSTFCAQFHLSDGVTVIYRLTVSTPL